MSVADRATTRSKDRLALALEFTAAITARKGPTCGTCKLPPEVLSVVRALRNAHYRSFQQIRAWLLSEGHDLSAHSLSDHFRKGPPHEPQG